MRRYHLSEQKKHYLVIADVSYNILGREAEKLFRGHVPCQGGWVLHPPPLLKKSTSFITIKLQKYSGSPEKKVFCKSQFSVLYIFGSPLV